MTGHWYRTTAPAEAALQFRGPARRRARLRTCCGCPGARLPVDAAVIALRMLGSNLDQDGPDLLRMVDALPDATARAAFMRTLRAVVDWRGHVVTMLDRCYLTRGDADPAGLGRA
jgi:hypothetical protein